MKLSFKENQGVTLFSELITFLKSVLEQDSGQNFLQELVDFRYKSTFMSMILDNVVNEAKINSTSSSAALRLNGTVRTILAPSVEDTDSQIIKPRSIPEQTLEQEFETLTVEVATENLHTALNALISIQESNFDSFSAPRSKNSGSALKSKNQLDFLITTPYSHKFAWKRARSTWFSSFGCSGGTRKQNTLTRSCCLGRVHQRKS